MKKKNEIEQELDKKEFENELNRDLSDQYKKMDVNEKLLEGTNPYVLGGMNFLVTLVVFEVFYWLIKWNLNLATFGVTLEIFEFIDPFVHLAIFILCISSVVKKKSAVEVIIDRWPF